MVLLVSTCGLLSHVQPHMVVNRVVQSSHFLATFQPTFWLLFVILAVKDIKVNLKSSRKVAEKCYFETPGFEKWGKVKSKPFLLFADFPSLSRFSAGSWQVLWHVLSRCAYVTCAWVPCNMSEHLCHYQCHCALPRLLPPPLPACPLNGSDSEGRVFTYLYRTFVLLLLSWLYIIFKLEQDGTSTL